MNSRWLNGFALIAVALAAALVAFGNLSSDAPSQILNVSYDATGELYKDINGRFTADYEKHTGRKVLIRQLNGESANQAQAVIAGLKADVVTLARSADIDALHARGLVSADWSKRLPHQSQPYNSTIVFVVRKGNPKHISDWPDLVKHGVSVVTPTPRASGDGRLEMMAAWGSVVYRGGDSGQARQFVARLQDHSLLNEAGAQETAAAFTTQKRGDVQLAWENTALREADEAKGALEVVYPPVSIRAEPAVAWVDAQVDGTGKEAVAKAYLQFLYSPQAQEVIALHDLRPADASVLKRHASRLPDVRLFSTEMVSDEFAKNWEEVQVAKK